MSMIKYICLFIFCRRKISIFMLTLKKLAYLRGKLLELEMNVYDAIYPVIVFTMYRIKSWPKQILASVQFSHRDLGDRNLGNVIIHWIESNHDRKQNLGNTFTRDWKSPGEKVQCPSPSEPDLHVRNVPFISLHVTLRTAR